MYYTAPSDYNALSTTITFTAGERQKDFDITTIDDSIGEVSETFTVELSNPLSGVMLGTSNVATVQISADMITVGFNLTTYTVSEGEIVTLTVILTGDIPTSDTTIDVMTMDGSASGITCV